MTKNCFTFLDQVRIKKPLIHHITNYVTVNDCANITLAIGASPIMADANEEVAGIASMASSIVLNMGTLNTRTIKSMLIAGKSANATNIPIVFDPVGAGISHLRNETAKKLLGDIHISVLCGNISEIRYLAGLPFQNNGVDASKVDLLHSDDAISIAKSLSRHLKVIVAITGAVDVISDGKKVVCINNGNSMLSTLTGTGCMCTSLIASFCGAVPDNLFAATSAALLSMGIAGEIAFEKAGEIGNGSFRVALLDAISRIDMDTLTRRAKYYETTN